MEKMRDFLQILMDYQRWIYLILGILAIIYLKRVISALNERQSTIFGLERENAQRKLNAALSIFILILLLIGAEFVLVTIIFPDYSQIIITPTTPVTETPEGNENMIVRESTPETSTAKILTGGCVEGQLEWIAPQSGEVIEGNYTLNATVNVQDMAFFQYTYAPLSDPENWEAISAGNLPIIEGELGLWAASQVPNGDYTLRLSVFDLNNDELPPCDVTIRVLNATE